MANKMLIDATHPEETRVVVLRGNRVEEFDFESAQRKQLRGNIYLAKVTRVEPSLQAAFIDYGGNRHGFLAFSEIHPDYYQIPVADRQALIEDEERAQRAADDEVDRRSRRHRHRGRPARRNDEAMHGDAAERPAGEFASPDQVEALGGGEPTAGESTEITAVETPESQGDIALETSAEPAQAEHDDGSPETAFDEAEADEAEESGPTPIALTEVEAIVSSHLEIDNASEEDHGDAEHGDEDHGNEDHGDEEHGHEEHGDADHGDADHGDADHGDADHGDADHGDEDHGDDHGSVEEVNGAGNGHENGHDEEIVESVGGSDAMEEVPDRAPRYRRQYKIQEVIKRRQVMLVQVVKEERGTKGAALTTYLSLAGRYSVLMPNTARGGGISRKITSSEDRARLKEAAADLEVPEGMGVILRTAGASRTKVEIKRDFEYLLRMWETVRDLTLKSTAPKLVYEEGSLIKRSIRDLYGKEIDEVIVAGDDAYHEAKDFMRMLMPTHAKSVKSYSDTQPLLSRYGVENQLDAMFSPVVQLRSGGYIVINQAEALVAIDVNSGRATREHHIEDTALKTNLEASDEIARQLRLRDLAGLIVIDFIDMDENRNNRSVERRLKECLKHDRARIQVGRISHFGLLEMSRQRIRTSVLESSTEKCPYCGGSGHVRSVSSLALQVLRALEDQLMKSATHSLVARTRADVAAYVLNQKRAHLRALEERFAITIMVVADETVAASQAFVVDRGEQVHTPEQARAIAEQHQAEAAAAPLEEEDDLEDESIVGEVEEEQAAEAEASSLPAENGDDESGEPRRRRRRRRGRGGRNGRDNGGRHEQIPINGDGSEPAGEHFASADDEAAADDESATGPHDEPIDGEREERPDYHGQRPDQDAEGHEHDGGRRRRRRGRRGGRRNRPENRQEGNGNGGYVGDDQPHQDFSPTGELSPPHTEAPVAIETAADFDAPSPPAVPAPVMPESTMPEPEAPRRRSTVREPAPVSSGDTFTPASSPSPVVAPSPEPAAETIATEEADKPRKTGWWSKRFGG